jgi:hypothetical protein
MQHVTMPLELTAAAWRVAGYVIEKNLRVAQAFGQAAMKTNPFSVGVRARPQATTPKSDFCAKPEVAAKPKAKTPKEAAKSAASERQPLSGTPKTGTRPETTAKPARKPAPKAKTRTANAAGNKPKRPRAPSKPPALPDTAEKNNK